MFKVLGSFAVLAIFEELDTDVVGSFGAGLQLIELLTGVKEELRIGAFLLIKDGGDTLEQVDIIRGFSHFGSKHLDQIIAGGIRLEEVVDIVLHTLVDVDVLLVLLNLLVKAGDGFSVVRLFCSSSSL